MPSRHPVTAGRFPHARLLSVIVGVGVLAAACGGPASSASGQGTSPSISKPPSTSTPPSTSAPHGVTVPTYGQGHVVPAPVGVSTTVPREVPGRPIDPVLDAGQQVVITARAFEPEQLNAVDDLPVVWTNLSGVDQRISFNAIPVRSGVIPPGGQYVWNPGGYGLTLSYDSPTGLHGVLILQPTSS